jgi:hypothetical protein
MIFFLKNLTIQGFKTMKNKFSIELVLIKILN